MKDNMYVSVLFRKTQKAYYVRCKIKNIAIGEKVVVKTKRGKEIGEVVEVCNKGRIKEFAKIEGKVLRKFTEEDHRKLKELEEKEEEGYRVCQEEINNLELPMKLLDVEYMLSGNKAIFYFSAEGRVDFRELVKRVAKKLKIRVEMRQVGVRDEAKMIGGLGPCGRNLCCATFLNRFKSISIRMAKDQGLPMNTFKISGLCGRLMCCLMYEEDNYREFLKCAPDNNQRVKTPDGRGKVVGYQVVKNSAEVELESGIKKTYPLSEIDWKNKPRCSNNCKKFMDDKSPADNKR